MVSGLGSDGMAVRMAVGDGVEFGEHPFRRRGIYTIALSGSEDVGAQ